MIFNVHPAKRVSKVPQKRTREKDGHAYAARIPVFLKEQLELLTQSTRRSLHAEILAALERHLKAQSAIPGTRKRPAETKLAQVLLIVPKKWFLLLQKRAKRNEHSVNSEITLALDRHMAAPPVVKITVENPRMPIRVHPYEFVLEGDLEEESS